ncbi:MAG: hypothetical protein RL754_468 [Bacteroidota bacterium]
MIQGCVPAASLSTVIPVEPDYAQLNSWAAHPEKHDLSDTNFTGISVTKDAEIPVFFVYPTVYFPGRGESWNADINSQEYRQSVQTPVLYQSTAFASAGPVYVPLYRQAAYKVYDVSPSKVTAQAYELAYNDVARAFDVFLNEIGDKPFILASHSQGTDHLERLMVSRPEFPWSERLVAAYLVGMPVDACVLPIPPCERPNQTGCAASWRTYREGTVVYSKVPNECLVLTNPLTWTTTTDIISRDENPGALINTKKPLYPKVAGARLSNGVVYTSHPKFPWSWALRTRNYHRGDINLYYQSVQENVVLRVSQFAR